MNIDRSRFLLLTAALSATACTTAESNPDGGTTTLDGSIDSTSGDTGTTTDAADGSTGSDASLDAGADGTATCDDSVGDVSACAPFAEGGSGTVDAGDGGGNCFTASAAQICANIPNVKPKIGEAIIVCTMADPTCEGIQPCVLTALGAACPDSTAATTCNPLVAMCNEAGADGGVNLADCTKYVSALTDQGRTAFTGCMQEGFPCDLLSCLGSLL